MHYTELQTTTNFTFLRGASHSDELVEYAAALGHKEIAITDRNTLAGIVRAHAAAKKTGIRIIVGCRLDLLDGSKASSPTPQIEQPIRNSAICSPPATAVQKKANVIYIKQMYINMQRICFSLSCLPQN